MPVSLVLLAIIALVLYILFGYLMPDPPAPRGPYFRPIVATIVIILVLLFWFVLPLRVG